MYGYQEGKEDQKGFVYPLKLSKEMNEHHVDLLLIATEYTSHYCFIKDFGRLVGSQYKRDSYTTYFCRLCLHGFSSDYTSQDKAQHRRTDGYMKEKLKAHEEDCVQHN